MRRRAGLLILLLLVLGGLALAGPHLWAWHHLRAARADLARYHFDDARAHLGRCLRVWPRSATAHLLAGRAARQAGDLEAADRHLRECQRLRQGATDDVTLEWSLLQAAAGNADEVEEYLHGRAAQSPDEAPLIWEALAQGYARVYRVLDALALVDRWLELRPEDVQALAVRGGVYRKVRASQSAAADFRRAVELDPERDDARWGLAVSLAEIGRYQEALTHLEQLRPRRAGDPELLVWAARCLVRLERRDEARRLLEEVLAASPDYGPALTNLGQLLVQAGRLEEAEGRLHQAVRAQPHNYLANYALYDCLNKQGKAAEAKTQLAVAEDIKGRLDRVAEITTRQMSARPHDPALHCELGTLFIRGGNPDVGERWLFSALQQDPNYRPAHAALADLYRQRGDAERAALHRRQAEAPGPSGPG
ncbi:MAG TPA: tetratricopeptide repeat protein [Gemmataceae bacterium]|jgi:predicted Zn-dependent protease|nr:tetratricopeptide repeat protein [Gemmataceae bacterium]